jgi:hypothetical protein
MAMHIYFKSVFKMFHRFQTYVASVYLDVVYVANVCSDCFICFKRMLQFFYLSVAKVDRCGGSLSPWWSSYCGSPDVAKMEATNMGVVGMGCRGGSARIGSGMGAGAMHRVR